MNYALFQGTNQDKLIKSFQIIKLKKNETIFHEKEEVESFYYLVSGKVNLYASNSNGRQKIFLTVNENDIINDFSTLNSSLPYGAVVFEKATLLKIKQSELEQLLANDFTLTKNILALQDHRNRRLFRQLKNTVSINLEKKVVAKLWKYAKDYGVQVEDDGLTYIDFKLNNTYLADMIGVSRESVSRAISKLIKLNLIKMDKSKYYVYPELLKEYYRK